MPVPDLVQFAKLLLLGAFWAHQCTLVSPMPLLTWTSGIFVEYSRDALHDARPYTHEWKSLVVNIGFGIGIITVCSLIHDLSYIATCLSMAVATAFYSRPLWPGGTSIKTAFPLSKTIFVGGVHGFWFRSFFAACDPIDVVHVTVTNVFTSALLDLKDIEDDTRAGVATIGTLLGHELACRCMLVASLLFASTCAVHGHVPAMFTFLVCAVLALCSKDRAIQRPELMNSFVAAYAIIMCFR